MNRDGQRFDLQRLITSREGPFATCDGDSPAVALRTYRRKGLPTALVLAEIVGQDTPRG